MEAKAREEGRRGSPGAKGGSTTRRYCKETKLRAVRLVLEEGFARKDVGREIGVCKSCLNRWVGNYRREGEAGLEDAALAQAARLLAGAPGEASGAEQAAVNDAALAEDLVWLAERGLPEAVRLLEHRWPDLQIDQPLTAYAAALALDAVGEQERAAALVESARDALRGPRVGFTARIRAALRLVRWGAVDRAVRAYESLLADPTLPAEEFAWASILFAEFLHDQGRSDRAADILQTVVTGRPGRPGEEPERVLPRLDRDPQTVASRMLYFRSCAAADRGAPDERRRLLEESLQAHPRDVDALIALYHLPDATPQQKGFVQ
ncbi:MAG: transposase, partial [Limisphaerales bacterium]